MPKINAANMAEHKERTYASLLQATQELIAEQGIESVSMAEIAKRAGVARTAIYNYAPDKESLLLASAEAAVTAIQPVLGALVAETSVSAVERLEGLIRLLLANVANKAYGALAVWALRQRPTAADGDLFEAQKNVMVNVVLDLLQQAVAGREIPEPADLTLVLDLMVATMERTIEHIDRDPARVQEISDMTVSFILGGLGAGKI
ncbi:TetR/AcrR family transcriptional regulator [Kocuria soli]|uniref:TetR/AcrR family transcriptional regulator n=1 Tax=Kocuria soli TaxID=2485125 RepID=A0A3N4A1G3_9MICC|nr:TetR/AcrR family transcriptional regulator [Kocuria soli]ROZ62064.1 TetR/AcrR family transcriptional regulator [Kocuria soli]